MTITNDAARVFADARVMYASAMDRLDAEDVRDASEKVWRATSRATDALILSRTGTEPEKSPNTTLGLDTLASQDPEVRSLVGRYFSRQGQLHGLCFYFGWSDPLSETSRRIRETIGYIEDAERLADA